MTCIFSLYSLPHHEQKFIRTPIFTTWKTLSKIFLFLKNKNYFHDQLYKRTTNLSVPTRQINQHQKFITSSLQIFIPIKLIEFSNYFYIRFTAKNILWLQRLQGCHLQILTNFISPCLWTNHQFLLHGQPHIKTTNLTNNHPDKSPITHALPEQHTLKTKLGLPYCLIKFIKQ